MLAAAIRDLRQGRQTPLVVAIDGRAGAGKSTLAGQLASTFESLLVIDGDDFYAGGSAEHWDAMSGAEKAAHCVDWRRQATVLGLLRSGRSARWSPYDWNANDGRLADIETVAQPAEIVVLEGAFSARPELAALTDLRVLLDAPRQLTQQRVRAREGNAFDAGWAARWEEAEDWYFAHVMWPEAFDLVVHG